MRKPGGQRRGGCDMNWMTMLIVVLIVDMMGGSIENGVNVLDDRASAGYIEELRAATNCENWDTTR